MLAVVALAACDGADAVRTPAPQRIAGTPEVQPDALIRRRSDGRLTGDGIYNLDGTDQTVVHAIARRGKWTFAVLAENDGRVAGDITITGPESSDLFAVRYFVGYQDVTTLVTGSGFTFEQVPAGASQRFAIQFRAMSSAPLGSSSFARLRSTSSGDRPVRDTVQVGVVVRP